MRESFLAELLPFWPDIAACVLPVSGMKLILGCPGRELFTLPLGPITRWRIDKRILGVTVYSTVNSAPLPT